jgi:hypothetical protein
MKRQRSVHGVPFFVFLGCSSELRPLNSVEDAGKGGAGGDSSGAGSGAGGSAGLKLGNHGVTGSRRSP